MHPNDRIPHALSLSFSPGSAENCADIYHQAFLSRARSSRECFPCARPSDHFKLRDMASIASSTRVGYCYDPRMTGHKHTSYDHPEQPARITTIFSALETSGCTSRMIFLPSREVSEDEVALVHSRNVWERVDEIECKVSSAFRLLEAYFTILRSTLCLYVHRSTPALYLRRLQR